MNQRRFGGLDSIITRAVSAYENHNFDVAISELLELLKECPDDLNALRLLGGIALDAGQIDLAHQQLMRAIDLGGAHAGTMYNLGLLHYQQGDDDRAIRWLDRALELVPDDASANTVLNQALHRRAGQNIARLSLDAAREDLERLLRRNPSDHRALFNLGALHFSINRIELALACIEGAIRHADDPTPYLSNWLHTKMRACAWDGLQHLIDEVETGIDAGRRTCTPMHYLALSDAPDRQLRVAQLWAPLQPPASLPATSESKGRIRIGYFSHDFKTHPVSVMLVGLFETHDHEAFEVFAFATNPGADSYRLRIEQAAARFIDVSEMGDEALVALARQYRLDIAVDLTGLTQGGRSDAFAMRMAPVQIQYLGYPGTSGLPNMDYVIVDRYIATAQNSRSFSEKLLLLSGTFQISDRCRPGPATPISRSQLGVPDGAFLFGCLCNTYKINAQLFDVWMDILKAVPNSALMLYAPTAVAQENLRSEARRREIDPTRLHFSERMPLPEYYARLGAIDLFLDTFPYNGGATANDALWMGSPLLTCSGRSFASRMGGSLLAAMNLDVLITDSLDQYRSAAIRLATSGQDDLRRIRHAIAAHRADPHGIFATDHSVRALESLYRRIFNEKLSSASPSD